jgi:hypothetical protein
MEENFNVIQSAGLNQEQKLMLQKFIDTAFKENIQMSGEQRQLDHLAMIYNNLAAQNNSQNVNMNYSSTA